MTWWKLCDVHMLFKVQLNFHPPPWGWLPMYKMDRGAHCTFKGLKKWFCYLLGCSVHILLGYWCVVLELVSLRVEKFEAIPTKQDLGAFSKFLRSTHVLFIWDSSRWLEPLLTDNLWLYYGHLWVMGSSLKPSRTWKYSYNLFLYNTDS